MQADIKLAGQFAEEMLTIIRFEKDQWK